MKAIRLVLILTVLACTSPLAVAEQTPCSEPNDVPCRELTESRCKQANEGMLQTMKSTPLDKPRDIERSRELIANVEKMLSDNRRQGVSECRSWADFSRIVVHQ